MVATISFKQLKIVVAVQDSTLSETGSQSILHDSHVCDCNRANLNKNAYIHFVLLEACVLDFCCEGETMMHTGR